MTKELFQRYAEIKNQMKVLEAEAAVINEKVVSEMAAEKVDKVESDYGQFYFTTRKSWKYSEALAPYEKAVEDASAILTEEKKKEQETGLATAAESKSLTFKAK
jgi:hypothetical protein